VSSSEKQEGIHKNYCSNFCESRLISEGVTSAPAVYTCLECETKVFFTLSHTQLFHHKKQIYFLIWLITSSAKLSSRFSIPSPTSKRVNDLTVAPLEATYFSTVISGSLTNG
jgi:hypothetical protein